jgi:hypothetical protein
VAGVMLGVMVLSMTGCGQPRDINGVHYPTKGLITMSEKDPNIVYEVSVGNVIWSVLLCETIVFPIYFLGFSMFNPVRLSENAVNK